MEKAPREVFLVPDIPNNYLALSFIVSKLFILKGIREFKTNGIRVGIFDVCESKLSKDLVSILQGNGVRIDKHDKVFVLHVPEQRIESLKEVKDSFDEIRKYIKIEKSKRKGNIPRYVCGISYLAPTAKRWGFTIVDLPKNIKEKRLVEKILKDYVTAKKNPIKQKIAKKFTPDDIKLCIIPTSDFLGKE